MSVSINRHRGQTTDTQPFAECMIQVELRMSKPF
ncbi:uncharacterized protein METZ01_LOCUS212492 [marine metagenome]|uniref:Uncharacterized protein n=1 Tax=marine metagenome TaxID=408172 RepID=A0A382F974_9ZZZZ